MIAVVDTGLGNLRSVGNAFRAVGAAATLSADAGFIRRAAGLVLPGVGSAQEGMERLQARGLDRVVRAGALDGQPVLGLCLGMQLLFDGSDEGRVSCLGLLPGQVRRLSGGDIKIPHTGWNQVQYSGESALWAGIPDEPYFYFVHSYICEPADPALIAGQTEYGSQFCSAVARSRIWGTQFHPERSGQWGLRLIQNFAALCQGAQSG